MVVRYHVGWYTICDSKWCGGIWVKIRGQVSYSILRSLHCKTDLTPYSSFLLDRRTKAPAKARILTSLKCPYFMFHGSSASYASTVSAAAIFSIRYFRYS